MKQHILDIITAELSKIPDDRGLSPQDILFETMICTFTQMDASGVLIDRLTELSIEFAEYDAAEQ